MESAKQMRLLLTIAAAAILAACASIGRPEGGERDMLPPKYVRSQPAMGELNVKKKKINLFFDENVTLDDPSNKIVVSPPQKEAPAISSNGRRVTVELRDTLRDSTTYTIDFSDAIKDLNEGNVLDGFAIAFSTGPTIDTLAISGMVFQARNLEPAQSMVVGVYANMTDTSLTTTRFDRITKTNQTGQFTIRNLAPGSYRIFAVNDVNHDFHWDRSEDIAFLDYDIVPTTEPMWVKDTITPDSIVERQVYRTLPDDVLLTWFNEDYKRSYLIKNERPERNKLYLEFATAMDSMPNIRIVGTELDGVNLLDKSVLEYSIGHDTITAWLTDSVLIKNDSLRMELTYMKTDSLDQLSLNTDTLKFNLRAQRDKKNKKEVKKKEEETDSAQTPKIEFMSLNFDIGQAQDLNKPITMSSSVPIGRLDSAAVSLAKMVDSLWVDIPPPEVKRGREGNPREFKISYAWEPGIKYRLKVDSASVEDIYGLHNAPVVRDFTTRLEEDYSALFFRVSGLDGEQGVVELLRNDDPLMQAVVDETGVATFEYLMPGSYYARLYIDRNKNQKWDTGSVRDSLQPEEVYYYPKKLNLKKNWDVEQSWNIYELPVDMQKPLDIKKNKPKKKKWEEDDKKKKDGSEDEEDDEWNTMSNDPFFNNRNNNNQGLLRR